ncbi:MAG TPA: right-handed parallel beta-helix repeat-containing protein, partial [Verrucomicrobiae bacterium]
MHTSALIRGLAGWVVLALLPAVLVEAAEYYVAPTGSDRNPGSQVAPWRTLNHGVTQLVAGDRLLVEPGVYPESLHDVIPAGTTVQGVNGQVILQPPAGGPVIQLAIPAAQSIRIEGLMLDAGHAGQAALIIGGGAGNITVARCEIVNSPVAGASIAGDLPVIENCVIHHNGGEGVRVGGNYSRVYLNTTYQNGGPGILLDPGAYRVEVIDNICWQNTGGDAIAANGDRPRIFSNLAGVDPQFVDAANGDFHLSPGSPAIDAGQPPPVGMGDEDFSLLARPQGIKWDIGAFEFPRVHGITTGQLIIERPTLQCFGFRWSVSGDENRNATVSVQYRRQGTTNWFSGYEALRINGEAVGSGDIAWVAPNLFAGSVVDLTPGAAYELRLTMTDPDGGPGNGVTTNFLSTTRSEPVASATGTKRHVYPAGYTGTKLTPNYGDVQSAYNAAVAGDIILVHAGNHQQDLTFNKVGTAAQPFVIRGAGDGEAKLQGLGNVLISAGNTAHHIIEDLTLYDADTLIQASAAAALTVRRCKLHTCYYIGVNGLSAGSKDFYIADNEFTGPEPNWTPRLSDGGPHGQTHAIWLMGQGHVVCYNRIAQWWDGVDLSGGAPPSDLSQQNCAVDFCNNDISHCMDDGIELDYGVANLRCLRNFLWNVFQGVSCQPVYGGPAYLIRNVTYNNTADSAAKLNQFPAGVLLFHNTAVGAGS